MQLLRRKFNKTSFAIIIIILLLLFLNILGILSPLNSFFSQPLIFIQKWFYSLGIGLSKVQVRTLSKSELIKLNQELEAQILVLTKKIAESKIFEEENKELVKQLDFLKHQPYRAVTARVVGKSPDYTEHILIINRGGKDGLAAGYPVIAEEGIMIGKILEVERESAKVMLLTDGHSKVAAAILNNDRTVGLVEGQYGLSMKMELIPRNEEVKSKDLVITSGLEEYIPKGLLIAKVDHLTTQPNDVFQSALLNFLVDFNKINIISVLLP